MLHALTQDSRVSRVRAAQPKGASCLEPLIVLYTAGFRLVLAAAPDYQSESGMTPSASPTSTSLPPLTVGPVNWQPCRESDEHPRHASSQPAGLPNGMAEQSTKVTASTGDLALWQEAYT